MKLLCFFQIDLKHNNLYCRFKEFVLYIYRNIYLN